MDIFKTMELNNINIYENLNSVLLDLNNYLTEHDHVFIFDIKDKIHYEDKTIEGINKKIKNNLEIIRSIKDHITISHIIERMATYIKKNMERKR